MFGSKSCNYVKLKTNLRLAINRFKLLEKKKAELAQQARREIAEQLRAGKPDRARIRVEHIIREDFMIEAMEMLEMYCDLLIARMGLIQHEKKVDEGLEEAITSLLWATPRLIQDVPELATIARELTHKYSTKYCEAARENQLGTVNQKLLKKLSVQAPRQTLVEQYLIEIARNFQVDYEADPRILQELQAPLIEIGGLPALPVAPIGGPSNRNPNTYNGGGGGGNFVLPRETDLTPQIYHHTSDASPPAFYPAAPPFNPDINRFADHYAAQNDEKPPPPHNPNLPAHNSAYDNNSNNDDEADEEYINAQYAPQIQQQQQQQLPHASINSSRYSTYNLPHIDPEKLSYENPNSSNVTLRRSAKAAEAAGSNSSSVASAPSIANGNGIISSSGNMNHSNVATTNDDEETDWNNKLPSVPTDNNGQQPTGAEAGPSSLSASTNLDDLMRRFERLKK